MRRLNFYLAVGMIIDCGLIWQNAQPAPCTRNAMRCQGCNILAGYESSSELNRLYHDYIERSTQVLVFF